MAAPLMPDPGPISPPSTASPDSRLRSSVSEAERIINEERLTGAKAMRIRAMVQQAKQSGKEGKVDDAQRIARQALRLARGGEEAAQPEPDAGQPVASETDPGAKQQSNADGDTFEPMERETTSFRDGSGDGAISLNASQPLTPAQAPLAIAEHETSHQRRNSREAILNGQRVLQSIRYHHEIDPASGEIRVTGGQARTLVFPKVEPPDMEHVRENVHKHLDLEI